MVELLDLRANYLGGQVRMTWGFPKDSPISVHIFAVRQSGAEMTFDPRFRITKDLRDCNDGITFDYSGVSDVDIKKITFCAFLADRNLNMPNVRALQSMPGCFVSVTIGQADVFFDVKSKPASGELISHQIVIKSSSSFDQGILGYSYNFNGKEITVELPGRISSGQSVYPPIYLIASSAHPYVCLVGGANSDVMISQRKIRVFRKLKTMF